jgi:hypothetical protein
MPDEQRRTITMETLDKLGFEAKKLEKIRVKELTELQRAKLLKVRPELMTSSIEFKPSKPSSSKGYLSFHSPLLVLSNPLPSNDIAVYSSAFQEVVFPGVQVEFSPIKKNKMHLVEFHVTLNSPKTYKFRVFSYPLASFQDISLNSSQVITALVPPFEGITSYGAAIQQRNEPEDNAGWMFHKIRITAVG